MRNKRKKIFRLVFISVVILFIALVIYKNKERIDLLKGDVSYEIGKIVSFEQGASVNPWFDYEFYIKDTKYIGKYNIIDGMTSEKVGHYKKFVGKYFYVKYSKEKPNFNEMNIDKPVIDSIVKRHSHYRNMSEN